MPGRMSSRAAAPPPRLSCAVRATTSASRIRRRRGQYGSTDSVHTQASRSSGHALGLHSSGMLARQGVGAALAGTVAEQTSPETAMAVMAAASVAVTVTVALAPGLRGPALRAPARPELAIPRAEDQHFQQRGAEDA
jgi:hypothetical protein